MCKELQLTRLAKCVSDSKSSALKVFFSAKTHKVDAPFRTIVSERGTWQKCVSAFLKNHLNELAVKDPYATKNLEEVTRCLQNDHSVSYGFSVDVEDLFYSVP